MQNYDIGIIHFRPCLIENLSECIKDRENKLPVKCCTC